MSASPYSVAMAMVWFTLASLIGCFILRRAEKWGLALVGMIFLLTALRIFVPLDITGSIIIRSQVVYPALQNGLRYSIAGRISVGDCLLLLWMIGTVVQLLRLARDLSRQRKLRNGAELQEGNEWLDSLFLAIAKEAGYHGHFRLAVAENAASAYQAGFLCPYILLPAEIDTFSDEDISNMLRHELRHFLNGDLWIKTGFQVMRGILWWNPIMPMLNQSIGQLLELRCDQQVCKHLSRSGQMSYMETLIKLMRNGTAGFAEAYVGYLGYDNDEIMTQRFQMLLLGKPNLTERIRLFVCYALCLLMFIVSYGFILQPWDPSPKVDEQGGSIFELTPDDGYIVRRSDGTLIFYADGTNLGVTIQEAMLSVEPFSQMQIIHER